MPRAQRLNGAFTRAFVVLRISEAVLSAVTIALTGLAVAFAVLYGFAVAIGSMESIWTVLIALVFVPFIVHLTYKATTDEGLHQMKQNRAFEAVVLLVTLLRDALAVVVLFRLVLYTNVLIADRGVEEGWPPLWQIVWQVIAG